MTSGKFADIQALVGQKFNHLEVLEHLGTKQVGKTKCALWKCKCDCGNYTEATTNSLRSNNKKTCGRSCEINRVKQRKPKSKVIIRRYADMTGKRFGNLVVIERVGGQKNGVVWLCKCDCGKTKEISKCNLISTKTCGCSGYIFTDLIGQKFGKLIVIKQLKSKKFISGAKSNWLCKCECDNEIEVVAGQLQSGHTKSCGCLKHETSHNYLGCYEDISYSYFSKIENSARKRGFEFNITIEDIWNQFVIQNKKCNLSGLDLCFQKIYKKPYAQTASIDRIDNSKGYIKDNIQILHKQINLTKHVLSQEEFIKMCMLIARNQVYKV